MGDIRELIRQLTPKEREMVRVFAEYLQWKNEKQRSAKRSSGEACVENLRNAEDSEDT